MFIHYRIWNGTVTEEHLLNCDHIIRAQYVPPHTTHESADESEDGEEHTYDHKSQLTILTTEQEVNSTYENIADQDVFGTATQSTTIKFHGDEADNVWALLVANINALQQF